MITNAAHRADSKTGMTEHQSSFFERQSSEHPGSADIPIHTFSKEIEMRRTILTLASFGALIAATSPAAAQAYAGNDRYCLQGRIWGYPGNCQFATYRQCLATASGTSAYCGINPRYAFAQQRGY
jgi:Protein of unknown function (DUF3551)